MMTVLSFFLADRATKKDLDTFASYMPIFPGVPLVGR